LIVEALTPLVVRHSGQEIELIPGNPITLPDEQAKQLLHKAQGKVRRLDIAGATISWKGIFAYERVGTVVLCGSTGWVVVREQNADKDFLWLHLNGAVHLVIPTGGHYDPDGEFGTTD
jgi:hypothetical protein